MIRIIHSIPDRCPDCGSENLSGKEQMSLLEGSNTLYCEGCGIYMILQEEEEEPEESHEHELAASFQACPHCCTVNEFIIAEGAEWCNGCGLDPNLTLLPPKDLAHLWKEGSGIRRMMTNGRPPYRTGWMYKFLTSSCGPHCLYESQCPQSVKNFTLCYKEEREDEGGANLLQIEGTEMGRGRKRRKGRKERKKERERTYKDKERATLACSSSGWYNEKYRNETENPQKSTHTGSGSGT